MHDLLDFSKRQRDRHPIGIAEYVTSIASGDQLFDESKQQASDGGNKRSERRKIELAGRFDRLS